MAVKDDLGTRMKEFYESVPKTKLMRRTPVAIRIDGKAFHTFTRGFQKPFDSVLMQSMQETMKYLCENIQGCVFGYTQSDEITLILVDYQKLTSSAWFDYEVQKMCSIAASMATMAFNKIFNQTIQSMAFNLDDVDEYIDNGDGVLVKNPKKVSVNSWLNSINHGAMFDARCFNIPKEEVTNLIYWRQLDATRNSIQMVGQANFSHKELQGKSCNDIQEMLFTEKNINWNDFPTDCKRGSACFKSTQGWCIDKNMPILKNESRNYVDKWIFLNNED